MKIETPTVSRVACVVLGVVFVLGMVVLGMRLKEVQVDSAPEYNLEKSRQSVRRVQTAGTRGRILDCKGRVLADNRGCVSIVCQPAVFQRRTYEASASSISQAIGRVSAVIGRGSQLEGGQIRRHLEQSPSMPLFVWRDVGRDEIARFSEHERELAGFSIVETMERTYPFGPLAFHALGYVGRDAAESTAGDVQFRFRERELRGRAGLEYYYDSYLRGVPGERNLLVDAQGYTSRSWEVVEPGSGPDLRLALDIDIQKVVERQLAGERGACVVIDPSDGSVLAMASAPTCNPNRMVPVLTRELNQRLDDDPAKPKLNRATGGTYAPGSTFKPITALAALGLGFPADAKYECTGVFEYGGMHLHCTSRWGHGSLALREAMMKSCNPFFCNLGCEAGTNALCLAARKLGLGSKTGIDYPSEHAGVVPDAGWKQRTYGERWYPGDLAQMSIGQGMLLVTPLQMAVVVGALGTGSMVMPRMKARDGSVAWRRPLEFPAAHLKIVREGMRKVAIGDRRQSEGTGWRGAKGVNAWVMGKTGTAEVGLGASRRKNTWFIAYARSLETVPQDSRREIAIAMVIENGMSGGSTTAPKVAEVLKEIFGESDGGQS